MHYFFIIVYISIIFLYNIYMEQDFLLINKNYQQLFNIKLDEENKENFDKVFKNTLKHIIKNNNISGKFKIINLFNGTEKIYRYNDINYNDNNNQLGGNNRDDFQLSWIKLKDYVENNYKNINKHYLDQLHKQFLNTGSSFGISNSELNNMFINLLVSKNIDNLNT